jgi:hypothetical protein
MRSKRIYRVLQLLQEIHQRIRGDSKTPPRPNPDRPQMAVGPPPTNLVPEVEEHGSLHPGTHPRQP